VREIGEKVWTNWGLPDAIRSRQLIPRQIAFKDYCRGQAPEKLIAEQLRNGIVERARPVFPYPVLARYSGKGDSKQADSFVPFDRSQH